MGGFGILRVCIIDVLDRYPRYRKLKDDRNSQVDNLIEAL